MIATTSNCRDTVCLSWVEMTGNFDSKSGPAGRDGVCTAIVEQVAAEKNVPAVDLEPRLYEVVDPDALANLFRNQNGDRAARVVFTFAGCRVTVESSDQIGVRVLGEPSIQSGGDGVGR